MSDKPSQPWVEVDGLLYALTLGPENSVVWISLDNGDTWDSVVAFPIGWDKKNG